MISILVQGESTFIYLFKQTETVVLNNMKRLTGKLANLEQQQSAVDRAEATRKKADLLTANLHRCKHGDSLVEVVTCPKTCARFITSSKSCIGNESVRCIVVLVRL